jgi:hypothetical protein
VRSHIDPVYLVLGVLFAIATGVAMASEVSILFVWAGIVLTTLSLVAGTDRAEQRRRR